MTKRGFASGIIFIYSGDSSCLYDTDAEVLFKPDSWFSYLFGTRESEFYGAVEISTGKATLFIPKLPEEYKVWCGSVIPPEEFRDIYDVDDVQFDETITHWLEEKLQAGAQIHLISGLNTDSGATAKPAKVPGSEKFASVVNTDHLHTALSTGTCHSL
jgi:Xaa-Pro dipeptidase